LRRSGGSIGRFSSCVAPRRDERGFTITELAVVLTLGSILLTSGVYGLRLSMNRQEIDGWVRSIVYDVSAGQQAAFTRRTSVTVSFQNQTFSVAVNGGPTLRQDTLPADITFGTTLQTVTFDRRGVPSAALNVTVTSASTARTYTITVLAGTGRVTFSEP